MRLIVPPIKVIIQFSSLNMAQAQKTVKISHGAGGTKKITMLAPEKPLSSYAGVFKRKEAPPVTGGTIPRPPQKMSRSSSSMRPSPASAGGGRVRVIPTIAQGTAAMSKGATPAMKKGAMDRQVTFINDGLYEALELLGKDMELEDPSYIFYFYHSYIKTHLEKELEGVRAMKTGGTNAPHLCHFTPLNKHLQVNPDVVELSQDVRSIAQLKFYKMLIFRIMERTNTALRDAGFKGKMYLKKNFYSNFQNYWLSAVMPMIEEEKKRREEEEEDLEAMRAAGEEEEEVIEVLEEDEGEDDAVESLNEVEEEEPVSP